MAKNSFFIIEQPKIKIIKDERIFQPDWIPPRDFILFREQQLKEISNAVMSFVKYQEPAIIYGDRGTGKTMCALAVLKEAVEALKKENLKIFYINCKSFSSEISFLRRLAEEFNYNYKGTMLPEYYEFLKKQLETSDIKLLIIFDEIEKILNTSGDDFIYRILEIRREIINSNPNSGISFFAISNNPQWFDGLDSRIKSRMYGVNKILFPRYDAEQLTKILKKRSEEGLYTENVEEGVIEKCASIAALECSGDARRAIELLKISCEIAEREGKKVNLEHVDKANEKIERSMILNIITSKSIHEKLVIYSVINLSKKNEEIRGSEIYEFYSNICRRNGIKPLTNRRVRDILFDYEEVGLITRKNIFSKYGRETRVISCISQNILEDVKSMIREEGVEVGDESS